MMKVVTILGQRVPVAFNLAAQIAYEDITGTVWSLDGLTTTRERMALYMACVIAGGEMGGTAANAGGTVADGTAANADGTGADAPGREVTMERLMTELTAYELAVLDAAVAEMMNAWYKTPTVMARKEEPKRGKKHAERP